MVYCVGKCLLQDRIAIPMNAETIRISKQIKAMQLGPAWHGPALEEVLEGITAVQAHQHPIAGAHSMWELVLHIISWRKYAYHRVLGDQSHMIDIDHPDNWPAQPDQPNEQVWAATQAELKEISASLRQILRDVSDDKLTEQTEGRNYDLYVLLHGTVQHDAYHAGQIALLRKLV